MMTVKKLAGMSVPDYLIRQVAAADSTERGRGATAIAYSAGWVAQGAQLAQRLAALVRASTTQPAK